MATPKDGGEETLRILNEGLERLRSDGTYEELYRKYFNEAPPS
jgi:glutamine transport system substrate-binding protein